MAFAINNSSGTTAVEVNQGTSTSNFLEVRIGFVIGFVTFEHIRTKSMIVDPLTKALPVPTFKGHVSI